VEPSHIIDLDVELIVAKIPKAQLTGTCARRQGSRLSQAGGYAKSGCGHDHNMYCNSKAEFVQQSCAPSAI
jgi:hypothetical protein